MDLVRMAALHAAGFAEGAAWSEAELSAMLGSPTVHAVCEGNAGFALLQIVAPEAEVLTLVVDPACRRQGHGRRLLQRLLGDARAKGAKTVFLEVAADNVEARALYAEAGFAQAGLRRGYYRRAGTAPVDALLLRCHLAA